MAATLITAPPATGYNGNDIWVEVETDLVEPISEGSIEIEFTSSGPSIGETLVLEWGGTTLTLTVAATTNSTATAIPTKGGGESLMDYHERVGEALKENGTITDDFIVTVHSDERIMLTARVAGVLDITETSGLSNCTVTVVDGIDPNTEPNLAAVVQIWLPDALLSDPETILTTLHGTYNTDTATAKFNIGGLFPVKPHLPNPAHIDPGIFTSWLRGEATDCFRKYYLRVADKYGTPAIPEALVRSESDYHIIHGADAADRDAVSTISLYADILHNYRRSDGGTFWKPLGDGMPDWLYVWMKSPLTDCNVEWTILWDDGTETTEPYGGTGFDLDIDTAYYIRSSPRNFNFTPTNPGAIPWYITFRIFGTHAEAGEVTLATVKYKAIVETKWERYLIFDNGRGGCEAVLFNGKAKETFVGTREVARTNRSADFGIDTGEFLAFNAEGQKTFELNSGWVEKWYLEHLRQLLLGQVWMIDFANERFVKLITESESVETSQTDQQLFALSIKVKVAWVDKASNV